MGSKQRTARSPRKENLHVTLRIQDAPPPSAGGLRGVTSQSARSYYSLAATDYSVMSSISTSTFSSCKPPKNSGRPLALLEYEGGRHLHPERLPSASRDRTVSMKLTELYDDNVDNLFMMAGMLRRLDLSGTQMFSFPGELCERLHAIERLILDNNSLAVGSFNNKFSELSTLREISLFNNKMFEIPSCWHSLKKLCRINLEQNSVENIRGIDNISRLRSLVIDHNLVDTFPKDFFKLKRLEILFASHNRISHIPIDVKNFNYLREVNMSYNRIQQIPPDIFLLPRVEYINVSHNNLKRLPTVNIKGRPKRKISVVDISYNYVIRFPEQLVRLAERLDLSHNDIKVVPTSVLKLMHYRTTQEIDVRFNPIITPPKDVCEAGLRAMIQHYHEEKIESRAYQGIKVFLIGSVNAGKTSLLQTMLDQQSRLTEEEEQTVGMEVYNYALDTKNDINDPKPLMLSIWDFSGNEFYKPTNLPFLLLPSIVLLVFDVSIYTSETFEDQLGKWIEYLIMKKNRAIFILVGTHSDLLSEEKNADVMAKAQDDTENFIKEYMDDIEKGIRSIESRSQISPALQEQYKQFLHLKALRMLFHPECVLLSSLNLDGFDKLEKVFIELATQTKTFPQVMTVVPSLWVDVENYFEDRANDEPIITFETFSELVQLKFALKHVAKDICAYFNDTGRAVWVDNDPSFSDIVMLSPALLADSMRILIRDNISEYLDDPIDKDEYIRRYLKTGLGTKSTLHRAKYELVNHGVLDPDLIKSLWGAIATDRQIVQLLQYFCENLDFGYVVGPRQKDGMYKLSYKNPDLWEKEKAAEEGADPAIQEKEQQDSAPFKGREIPRVVITMYRKTRLSESVEDNWNLLLDEGPAVCAIFKFPRGAPPGLYHRAVTQLHNVDQFLAHFDAHWADGVQIRSLEKPVAMRLGRRVHEDGMDVIRMESRVDPLMIGKVRDIAMEFEDTPDRRAAAMWSVLLPVVQNIEKLLKQYSGAWFRRLMECPFCHEFCFLGEWLTPKDLQNINTKSCQLCQKAVPTLYLVQPKERRRAEEILRMKNAIRERQAAIDKEGVEKKAAETESGNPEDASASTSASRSSSPNKKRAPRSRKTSVTASAASVSRKLSTAERSQTSEVSSDVTRSASPRKRSTIERPEFLDVSSDLLPSRQVSPMMTPTRKRSTTNGLDLSSMSSNTMTPTRKRSTTERPDLTSMSPMMTPTRKRSTTNGLDLSSMTPTRKRSTTNGIDLSSMSSNTMTPTRKRSTTERPELNLMSPMMTPTRRRSTTERPELNSLSPMMTPTRRRSTTESPSDKQLPVKRNILELPS